MSKQCEIRKLKKKLINKKIIFLKCSLNAPYAFIWFVDYAFWRIINLMVYFQHRRNKKKSSLIKSCSNWMNSLWFIQNDLIIVFCTECKYYFSIIGFDHLVTICYLKLLFFMQENNIVLFRCLKPSSIKFTDLLNKKKKKILLN